ncbi:MAG: hypothetical protein II723_03140 [Oscillospiraceae bacterium]|nr:hypothetical protein [Oscillospiraceae bacterium]
MPYDPAAWLDRLRAVTPDDITAAANRLRLCTVYRLLGTEEGGQDNA